MNGNSVDELISQVSERLHPHGLDIVTAFDIAQYNDLIAGHELLAPVSAFGRRRALGLLVGNTRALWLCFLEACRASEDLQVATDPLDTWIEGVLIDCVDHVPCKTRVRFSHDASDARVSMLHMTEASGIAHVGPAHLGVHARYGPWFALRGVIIFDAEPPEALRDSPDPCDGCAAPCRAALDTAVSLTGGGRIEESPEAWIAVRDACPVGTGYRYSQDQLRYHYTKDRSVLPQKGT